MSFLNDFNQRIRLLYLPIEEGGEGLSLYQIGKTLGVSVTAVRNRLRSMGIELRTRGGKNNTRTYLERLDPVARAQVTEILLDEKISLYSKSLALNLHPNTIRTYIAELTGEKGEDANVPDTKNESRPV